MPIKPKTGNLLRAGTGLASAWPLHDVVLPHGSSATIEMHMAYARMLEHRRIQIVKAHPSANMRINLRTSSSINIS